MRADSKITGLMEFVDKFAEMHDDCSIDWLMNL